MLLRKLTILTLEAINNYVPEPNNDSNSTNWDQNLKYCSYGTPYLCEREEKVNTQ